MRLPLHGRDRAPPLRGIGQFVGIRSIRENPTIHRNQINSRISPASVERVKFSIVRVTSAKSPPKGVLHPTRLGEEDRVPAPASSGSSRDITVATAEQASCPHPIPGAEGYA
jgi:hypothetical protein